MSLSTNQASDQATPTKVSFSLKLALVAMPVAAYAIALAFWGFRGINEAIDCAAGVQDVAVLVHGLPIIWLMFAPLFLVPGTLRRSPHAVRHWFTPELAMQFNPESVSMAAGAHTSMQFDVRDLNEQVLATGKCATAPLPSTMQIDVGESRYEAIYDWADDPAANGWTEHQGRQLRVVRRYANPDREDAVLLTYVRTCYASEPHLITFNGAPDLWLRPNPKCSFPRIYDMVVEDQVVGQVRMPGRWLFHGVLVLTDHYPPGVRAVIAAACYQMMRG